MWSPCHKRLFPTSHWGYAALDAAAHGWHARPPTGFAGLPAPRARPSPRTATSTPAPWRSPVALSTHTAWQCSAAPGGSGQSNAFVRGSSLWS